MSWWGDQLSRFTQASTDFITESSTSWEAPPSLKTEVVTQMVLRLELEHISQQSPDPAPVPVLLKLPGSAPLLKCRSCLPPAWAGPRDLCVQQGPDEATTVSLGPHFEQQSYDYYRSPEAQLSFQKASEWTPPSGPGMAIIPESPPVPAS